MSSHLKFQNLLWEKLNLANNKNTESFLRLNELNKRFRFGHEGIRTQETASLIFYSIWSSGDCSDTANLNYMFKIHDDAILDTLSSDEMENWAWILVLRKSANTDIDTTKRQEGKVKSCHLTGMFCYMLGSS